MSNTTTTPAPNTTTTTESPSITNVITGTLFSTLQDLYAGNDAW